MSGLLDLLRSYLRSGWRLLAVHSVRDGICTCSKRERCDHPGKHPVFKGGCHSATTDEKLIQTWFEEKPWLNWGIATGTASDLLVLDIDPRHGGDESLARLIEQHGLLPKTLTVKTGGGGTQFYFRYPVGSGLTIDSGVRPGIDFRGDGGMVVVPPSLHLSGLRYEWDTPTDTPLADPPAWLVELLRNHRSKSSASPSPLRGEGGGLVLTVQGGPPGLTGDGAPDGVRHHTLCRLVGIHLARNDSRDTLEALVTSWAARCTPPMDEAEAEEVLNDLWDKHHGQSDEDAEEVGDENATPVLDTDAYYGLFGAMLRAVEPEMEATPAGALLGWMTCFGNAIGRTAHFMVKGRPHYPCLFVANVADTGDGKEDTWDVALWPFQQLEPQWTGGRILGVGSGEGMVEQVGDPAEGQAVPDKRLLIRLGELGRAFKVGRRDGSTFGELLLEAWDGKRLSIPNRKPNDLTATGYSISVFGDITPAVLTKVLATGTEAEDGTANRFLFNLVRPVRDLASGGDIGVLRPFLGRLAEALTFARTLGEVKRDGEAEALWVSLYPSLKRLPKIVPHTHRARPYVMRLALLYALADLSSVIRLPHLKAALAVWRYCEGSAKSLFGDVENIAPNTKPGAVERLALRLVKPILTKPGINRRELYKEVSGKASQKEMSAALTALFVNSIARSQKTKTDGRTGECWFPITDTAAPTPPASAPDEPMVPKVAEVKIEELPVPNVMCLEPPMTAEELFEAVRQRGGRFSWVDGSVQAAGLGEVSDRMRAAVAEHQNMLRSLVPAPQQEPSVPSDEEFLKRMRSLGEGPPLNLDIFPKQDPGKNGEGGAGDLAAK